MSWLCAWGISRIMFSKNFRDGVKLVEVEVLEMGDITVSTFGNILSEWGPGGLRRRRSL